MTVYRFEFEVSGLDADSINRAARLVIADHLGLTLDDAQRLMAGGNTGAVVRITAEPEISGVQRWTADVVVEVPLP